MSLDEIKREERKLYKKYAAFILAGALLIASGWKWKSVWGDVCVISGGIIIIISITVLSSLFDNFYKIKGKIREAETGEEFKETYIEWPGWAKRFGGIICAVLALSGISLLAVKHENSFGGNTFLWACMFSGVTAGFVADFLLKLKFRNWSSSLNKKREISFYIVLSALFLSVCLGPLINETLATGSYNCQKFQLIPFDKNNSTRKKFIHVIVNGKKERFDPPRSFFNQLSGNEREIILCVQKGFLGYEFVEAFKLP
jgi:hypothetical protein